MPGQPAKDRRPRLAGYGRWKTGSFHRDGTSGWPVGYNAFTSQLLASSGCARPCSDAAQSMLAEVKRLSTSAIIHTSSLIHTFLLIGLRLKRLDASLDPVSSIASVWHREVSLLPG